MPFSTLLLSWNKLARHLQSRNHKITKEKSVLLQSYLIRSIDYYSLVCKSNLHVLKICIKCHQFYSRTDSHLEYTHQLKRNSTEFKHALSKCQRHTHQFNLACLQEIQKTNLVENELVPSQELLNFTDKTNNRKKLKETSTITWPISNEPVSSQQPKNNTGKTKTKKLKET